MPILKHAALAPDHELNKAVDAYNLIPHDKYDDRLKALDNIKGKLQLLDEKIHATLDKWIKNINGLQMYIESEKTYNQTTPRWKAQLKNEVEDNNSTNNDKFKP